MGTHESPAPRELRSLRQQAPGGREINNGRPERRFSTFFCADETRRRAIERWTPEAEKAQVRTHGVTSAKLIALQDQESGGAKDATPGSNQTQS